MTAAVLAPGPSLSKHLPLRDGYDLTIGVNRAALAAPCGVWACLDYPVIRDQWQNVAGSPLLLTRKQTWEDIGKHCGLKLAAITDDYRSFVPTDIGWTLYTCTSAIVFAALKGATRIDVYGADMTGTGGFDAEDTGENRSEARWASERVVFDKLVAALGERRVVVNRIV
jgi:hypothetical protein